MLYTVMLVVSLPKSPEYKILEKLTVPQLKRFCEDQGFRISFTTKKETLPKIVRAIKYRGISVRKLSRLALKYQKAVIEEEEEKIREIKEITRRRKKVTVTRAEIRAKRRLKKAGPSSTARKIIRSLKRNLRSAMLRIPKDEREIEQAARGILLSQRIPVVDQVGSIEFLGKKYTPDMVVENNGSKIAIEIKRVSSKRDLERATSQAFAYASEYSETIIVLYDIKGIVEISRKQIREWENKRIYVLTIKH